jgi:hypothetical protein
MGTVTISVSVIVEAKSKTDALRLAGDAPMMSLCYSCSRGEDGTWCTSGELDGEAAIDRDRVEKV